MPYPEIKRFVQEILGCACPEEVFAKIDYQKESHGMPGKRINVGDRLLIYIISMDRKSGIQGVIDSALEQGVRERDKKGFNRFRLVLAVACPDELRGPAEHVFCHSRYTDEKTHLHVLNEKDVRGF